MRGLFSSTFTWACHSFWVNNFVTTDEVSGNIFDFPWPVSKLGSDERYWIIFWVLTGKFSRKLFSEILKASLRASKLKPRTWFIIESRAPRKPFSVASYSLTVPWLITPSRPKKRLFLASFEENVSIFIKSRHFSWRALQLSIKDSSTFKAQTNLIKWIKAA